MATIAEQLTSLANTKTAIKNAIVAKGVTVADDTPFSAYATKISEISGGSAPATKYGASVDTWIGDVDADGVLQKSTWNGILNFVGVKEIAESGLMAVFYCRTGITSVDFSSLQSVGQNGFYNAFYGCTGLMSVDFSSLQSVGRDGLYTAFYNCRGITSVDFSSLQSIGQNGFYNAFYNCSKLTTMSFPALIDVQANSFGSLSSYAFTYCTALTEIHFRADMQTTIEVMTGYDTKFGATNATIYFDL